jgi:hypothetical protein
LQQSVQSPQVRLDIVDKASVMLFYRLLTMGFSLASPWQGMVNKVYFYAPLAHGGNPRQKASHER